MPYTITITDNYTPPTDPIATNEDYLAFVMNMAAKSYATQYGASTSEAGITAAREAFNAALPQPAPVEEPVEGE
jgi:hypothetical protein